MGLPILSYLLLYIVSIPTHDIDDHMETNNRKDRLNRLRLRSDDTDDPYDRDDYMETRLKRLLNVQTSNENNQSLFNIVTGGQLPPIPQLCPPVTVFLTP